MSTYDINTSIYSIFARRCKRDCTRAETVLRLPDGIIAGSRNETAIYRHDNNNVQVDMLVAGIHMFRLHNRNLKLYAGTLAEWYIVSGKVM